MTSQESGALPKVEKLIAHSIDWTISERSSDEGRDVILGWGLTQESESVCIRIPGYPMSLQLELPVFVNNRPKEWTINDVNLLYQILYKRLGSDHAPCDFSFSYRFKSYYATNVKSPIITAFFPTILASKKCVSALNYPLKTGDHLYGDLKIAVWENDIDLVRKYLTSRNLRYSAWYECEGYRVPDEYRITTATHEFVVQPDKLLPKKGMEKIATRPMILSMDIECYSDRMRAMPNKFYASNVAYMICCVSKRLKAHNDTKQRHGIILGDCNHIPEERLKNVKIIKVSTEAELVYAYSQVVIEVDPDILTGYNIYGFDNDYLDARLSRLLCNWKTMGRLIGEQCKMYSKTWKSGGFGYNKINYPITSGRISLDVLTIVKRNFKLSKYDLNTVSRKFLHAAKLDMSAPEMFRIFARLRDAITKCLPFWYRMQSDPQLQTSETFIEEYTPFAKELEEAKEEITLVLYYCLKDAELPLDLFEKLNVWPTLVADSNVNGIPPIKTVTGGKQSCCMSQYFDYASRSGVIVDHRDGPTFPFTGGAVAEPVKGVHNNVIILDFASMYPSIMIRYNICYTTFVHESNINIPDSMCHVLEVKKEDLDDENNDDDEDDDEDAPKKKKKKLEVQEATGPQTKEDSWRFRFLKQEYRKGIIPQIVDQLVADRRAVRKEIENIEKLLDQAEIDEKICDLLVRFFAILVKPDQQNPYDEYKNYLQGLLVDLAAKKTKENDYIRMINRILGQISTPNEETNHELRELVAKLSEAREERKVNIENYRTSLVVMDKQQLAIKVSANSFFGFLGVREGAVMSLIEGAMSITSQGRKLIKLASDYVIEKYGGRIIYGDTDSFMVDLGITDSTECDYWGHRLSKEINGMKKGEKDPDGNILDHDVPGLFPSPLKMEFEKAARIVCFKKKKYAYFLINKDGTFKTEDRTDDSGKVIGTKYVIETKGIVVKRRDNCVFLRENYYELLEDVLLREPFSKVFMKVVEAVRKIFYNEVPAEKLLIVRSLGDNYKSPNYFMKVFAEWLRSEGKIVNPGDRLEYLIITDPSAKKVSSRMRLHEQFIEAEEAGKPMYPDREYYITKSLMNPIDQLVGIGYQEVLRDYQDIYLVKQQGRKITLQNPIKFLYNAIKMNMNIDSITHRVLEREQYVSKYGSIQNVYNLIYRPLPKIIRPPVEELANPFAHLFEDTQSYNTSYSASPTMRGFKLKPPNIRESYERNTT